MKKSSHSKKNPTFNTSFVMHGRSNNHNKTLITNRCLVSMKWEFFTHENLLFSWHFFRGRRFDGFERKLIEVNELIFSDVFFKL